MTRAMDMLAGGALCLSGMFLWAHSWDGTLTFLATGFTLWAAGTFFKEPE